VSDLRPRCCHVTTAAQARLALGELRGALHDAEAARAAAPKDAAAAALVEACEDALYDARDAAPTQPAKGAAAHTNTGSVGADEDTEAEPDAAALAFARQCAPARRLRIAGPGCALPVVTQRVTHACFACHTCVFRCWRTQASTTRRWLFWKRCAHSRTPHVTPAAV
jgi:hypothetical protein